MKFLWLHCRYQTLELLRQPAYLLSTVIFPSMFFGFFGIPNATSEQRALVLLGSFSAYAVLGVLLFQFAVSIAQERGSPWSSYLRLLPGPAWANPGSQLLTGLLFAMAAVGGVVLTALLFTPLEITKIRWLPFLSSLILGSFPFGLIGLVIGLTARAQTALPLSNLVYLPLSFAGGLWLPPSALPQLIQDISPALPSRMYGEWVWASLLQTPLSQSWLWGLGLYSVVLLPICYFLFKQEEERNYR